MTFHLVLVSEIHLWEKKGWRLINNRVHVGIGGWFSVWMEKDEN